MRLQWTVLAIEDRDALFLSVEVHDAAAAIRMDERIGSQVDGLARFPRRGRPGRVPGTRELVVSRTPHIVAYRVSGDAVLMPRLLHGAQRWPYAL